MDYSTQSKSVQSKTDGLGIIRNEGDWSSTEKVLDTSVMLDEGSRSHFCACMRTKFPYPGNFWNYSKGGIFQNKEEGFDEAYTPSSESSMRVCFPRHLVRV